MGISKSVTSAPSPILRRRSPLPLLSVFLPSRTSFASPRFPTLIPARTVCDTIYTAGTTAVLALTVRRGGYV